MSVLIAARTLGTEAGWSLTNLHMQKVLYIAQMLHMGRTGRALFNDQFEAWEYGPVAPTLYHKAKSFKDQPVASLGDGAVFDADSSELQTIRDALAITRHMSPGQLVTYLHRPSGAWEANFCRGEYGCVIPQGEILQDWERFMRPSDEAVAWAEQMATEIEARPSQYISGERERAFRARLLDKYIH